MKRSFVLTASAVTVAGVVILLGAPAHEPAVRIGAAAPELHAFTIEPPGEPRRIGDYRGQVILLNVWATWCPPCREEMPSMQALYEALQGRGLRVVAVSIDDPGSEEDIREFTREQALTFEILHDPASAIMDDYDVGGVPQTFLIDRAGKIRYVSFVADWRTVENRRRVEKVLADPH